MGRMDGRSLMTRTALLFKPTGLTEISSGDDRITPVHRKVENRAPYDSAASSRHCHEHNEEESTRGEEWVAIRERERSQEIRGGCDGRVAGPEYHPTLPDYMSWWEQQGEFLERRQLFLRSYHFSRRQGPRQRVRRTLLRVRRLVWARLRAARRLPRLLWAKLRAVLSGGGGGRRRHSHRLGSVQFQRLPHRRSASNSSSGSSAEWSSW
ncbi:hypothetical protein B296_00058153 [Ensete ventricosum]|uniref:Uncharacterized protein n=1 Tax=Ensete ventricosum TaxID=4639 RepID=A0A426XNA4_ENSVE|nr:hypothetical protein B296_00058153 [Ensete ventricosum]